MNRPERICAFNACSHLQCVTWWNMQAIHALIASIEKLHAELRIANTDRPEGFRFQTREI